MSGRTSDLRAVLEAFLLRHERVWRHARAECTRRREVDPECQEVARAVEALGTAPPSTSGARLELRSEARSGLRHYLDGRPVHAGDGLELRTAGDRWIAGRYEWSFRREDLPLLYLDLGEDSELRTELPPGAVLRWPEAP